MKDNQVGFYGGNVGQEMAAKYEEIQKKQKEITEQAFNDAKKAQDAIKADGPDIANTAEKIQGSMEKWKDRIADSEKATISLNKQLDGTLDRAERIANAMARSNQVAKLDEQMREEERRGLLPGSGHGSSGSW
jgi:ABC-type transporter Mla subunit MlaD